MLQSKNVNPAKTDPATTRRPYTSPKLMTRRVAAEDPLPLPAALVAAAPPFPNPEYTTPPVPDDAEPLPVAVADMVVMVDVLTRVGFCAPQG